MYILHLTKMYFKLNKHKVYTYYLNILIYQFISVQLLSRVRLFVTP